MIHSTGKYDRSWSALLGRFLILVATHLKNMIFKFDHFPNFRDENEHIFELPPPSDCIMIVCFISIRKGRKTNQSLGTKWLLMVHVPPLKVNIAPENRESQKDSLIFQPSIFRGGLLNFQRVNDWWLFIVPPFLTEHCHVINFFGHCSARCCSRRTSESRLLRCCSSQIDPKKSRPNFRYLHGVNIR